MPTVQLDRRSYKGDVPDVCMRCGAPAPERVKQTFSWVAGWVHFIILISPLIWLILVLVLRKVCHARLPMCEQHKNHWLRRKIVVYGSLLFGIALAILVAFATSAAQPSSDLEGLVCVFPFVIFLIWVIVAAVIMNTAIRASKITEGETLHLTNVCREFVDAYEDLLDREDSFLDKVVRERWNEQQPREKRGESRPLIREDRDDEEDPGKKEKYRPE
jgi:hypothetical protein